jgi:outer membrane protein assembly factor BamB
MYARAGERGLRVFDLTTGKELWSYKTSQVSTGPCLADNTVVFGSRDSHIYAFRRNSDTSDAELAWEFQTNGAVACRPAAQSGIVYAGSGDGYVYALNAGSGDLLDKIYVGEPLVAIVPTGRFVLALGNSNIYALSPNG